MHPKCIQIERRVMEEKWKPHPTRANIFINQSNGLLNESSIYFARIFYSFGD